MNLRNAENYTVGLDLGTGSVGWAVVDDEGELFHIKGQPTWGSRLFASADTAAATRLKRGQRRRYARRRQRLDELQKYFFTDMVGLDPDFFVRLRQARLLSEDKSESIRGYRWPLFNGSDFTEAEYYRRFPTIYHLRKYLMESDEKADLRLIYLAFHHIVKYRGNFLHESEGASLKAQNANAEGAARELSQSIEEYFRDVLEVDAPPTPNVSGIQSALDGKGIVKSSRATALLEAFGARDAESKNRCKLIARACVGYKVDYGKLVDGLESVEGTSFSLADEETAQAFVDEVCPDEARRLFDAIQGAYSSFVLSGILKGAKSLSAAMVSSYDQHQQDLHLLKGLFRDYLPREQYLEFFRGALDDSGRYDINELVTGSYTSYIAGEKLANRKGTSHEQLIKRIRNLCESCQPLMSDERYIAIRERLEAGDDSDVLLKQRTRSNGAIPYQLHREEMDAIIERQRPYYPFLAEYRDELERLVSSRIPYYVGPLNSGHDPLGHYPGNNVDPSRKFGWSVRAAGKEGAKAYPWNIDEVIDTDTTANLFIQRMTGSCTYILGEPVLPRHSLLYEEFCALNELNGARWCRRGGTPRRFDHVDKEEIFKSLFKGRRSANVSYELVKKWLLEERGAVDAEVSGGQGETGFESKLGTYHDFCKIFGVRSLEDEAPLSLDELEEIVLWNTVFEDRSILRRRLQAKYGPEGDGRLSAEQIKRIVNKRYTGWGRLSRRFLTGIRVPASVPSGSVTIMDVLRYGNPHANLRQLVLMEVINDRELGFSEVIDAQNRENLEQSGKLLSIDDMQGSPANRRAVNQAMRILDEIIGITGKLPRRICVEVTRDDDFRRKGSRTRSRYDALKNALAAYKEDAKLCADLDVHRDDLDDDRLMLYFAQQGKCMYSGERLDITQLSSYQIDHILPQSYIKDDSLDNRVLVKSIYNQRKSDSLLLDNAIIDSRIRWWRSLREAGLISEKKFARLTCRSLSERQINGFINRQLVETSQIVKFVRQMCEQRYPGVEIVSVRASISHGVRDNLGLVKCRELNNYHHAHDAYLACQVAEFIDRCYPKWQDGFSLAIVRKYVANLSSDGDRNNVPGRSGFIVDSMTRIRHVDETTGEITWDNAFRNARIRSCLGYRSCFISRMTEVATGAFWDETVYSPRDSRNGRSLSTPLKSSGLSRNAEGYLDPQKYGGVSSVKQAYWFIFAAKDRRGQYKYFFEGVPIHLAGQVGEALKEYADAIAHKAGCNGAKILRARVPLRQKLELHGTPYYLYGSTGGANEIRPALELSGSERTALLISKLFSGELLEHNEAMELYEWLTLCAGHLSPKLASVMKLGDRRGAFDLLTKDDKAVQLRSIVNKLNRTGQTVDLKKIGGAPKAGLLTIRVSRELPNITWIDQSVTGIFERKATFEDLCRGL